MATIKIEHSFDFHEEKEHIQTVMNAAKYKSILWDLDQEIRRKLKYDEDAWLKLDSASDYLEHLRSMIWESGVFNE